MRLLAPFFFCVLLSAAVACKSDPKPENAPRALLREVGPSLVEIAPKEGQPPFCLAFTAAQNGVVRQLTMSPENESLRCDANRPIGDTTYRIPPAEGAVQVYVVLSDQVLDAGSVGDGLHSAVRAGRRATAMDLRAPGQVLLERLEYSPTR